MSNESITMLPENIRLNLKGYKTHIKLTCLECGYTGLMGVKENIVPWYVTWWAIGIVSILFSVVYGIGIVFGIVMGIMRASSIKHLVCCPSCNRDLITK